MISLLVRLKFLIVLFFVASCVEKETIAYQSDAVKASGEFLFEGPNTLQGPMTVTLDQVMEKVEVAEIDRINMAGISLTFADDSLRQEVESLLVQLVSDNLPLQTVGTLSPLGPDPKQILQVNKELDILPYLKDATTQLVVDANLVTDMDEMEVYVAFEFSIIK